MAPLERIAAALVRGWARTLRVTFHTWNGERIDPADAWLTGRVYAVCERDILSLLPFTRHHEYVAAVAGGRDGDRATAVLQHLGVQVARGSVRAGGASAMRSILRAVTPERSVLLSVDGPLGPAGAATPGVIVLAARCRRDVVPLSAAARWAIRFPRTWSGIYLPLPFSRVAVQSAEPLSTRGAAGRDARTRAASLLTMRLEDARRGAQSQVRAS